MNITIFFLALVFSCVGLISLVRDNTQRIVKSIRNQDHIYDPKYTSLSFLIACILWTILYYLKTQG